MEKTKKGFGLRLKSKKAKNVEQTAQLVSNITTPLTSKKPSTLYKEVLKSTSKSLARSPRQRTDAPLKEDNENYADFHCSFDSDDDNLSDISLPLSQPNTEKQILLGVIAYVEVRSNAENRFDCISKQMEKLGAVVVKKFIPEVTHVVYKDGKKSTRDKAIKKGVHLVNVLWVEGCRESGKRVFEELYPVIVKEDAHTPIIPGRVKRNAKSMQPRSFEEDLRNSAERVSRRRRRKEAADKMSPLSTKVLSYQDSPCSPALVGPCQSPHLFQAETPSRPKDTTQDIENLSVSEKMELLLSLEKPKHPRTKVSYSITPTSPRAAPPNNLQTDFGQRKKRKRMPSVQETSPENSDKSNGKNVKKKAKTVSNCETIDGASSHNNVDARANEKSKTTKEIDVWAFDEDERNNTIEKFKKRHSGVSREERRISDDDVRTIAVSSNSLTANDNNLDQGDDDDDDDEIVCSLMTRCRSKRKSLKDFRIDEKVGSILEELDIFAFNEEEEPKVETTKKTKLSRLSKSSDNGSSLHSTGRDNDVKNKDASQKEIQSIQTNEIMTNEGHSSKHQQSKVRNRTSLSDSGIHLSEAEDNSTIKKPLTKKRTLSKSKQTDKNTKGKTAEQSVNAKDQAFDDNCNTKRCEEVQITDIDAEVIDDDSKNLKNEKKRNGKRINDETEDNIETDTSTAKTAINKLKKNRKQENECNEDIQRSYKESNQANSCAENEAKKNRNRIDKVECNRELINIERDDNPELLQKKMYRKSSTGKMKIQNEIKRNDRKKEESEIEHKEKAKKSVHKVAKENNVGTATDMDINQITKEKEQNKRKTNNEKTNIDSENKVDKEKQSQIIDNAKKASSNKKPLSKQNTNITMHKKRWSLADDDDDDDDDDNDGYGSAAAADGGGGAIGVDGHQVGDDDEEDISSTACEDTDTERDLNDEDEGEDDEGSGKSESETATNTTSRFHKKTIRTKKPSRSLVLTSMHFGDQDVVISVIRKLGGFYITDQVSSDTTHVVSGNPKRTLNVLYAIAQGCWLVSPEWVMKSLEAGYWIDEEPYELSESFPSAQLSRLERANAGPGYRQELFNDVEPIYVCENTSPPTDALIRLITLCGGKICTSIRKAGVYVGKINRKLNGMKVSEKWVIDSITEHTVLPFDSYIL